MSSDHAPLHWPTPPYAAYPASEQQLSPQPCLVEGTNGQTRDCVLVDLDPAEGVAHIQVPPSRATMPLRFDMFRRLRLQAPLMPAAVPNGHGGSPTLTHLLDYRPPTAYQLQWAHGPLEHGRSIGHIETEHGLFLFAPIDDDGGVERSFIPRRHYQQLQVGEAIGRVLVEQRTVTPEQVAAAVETQEALRNRKLGDYLLIQEIVKPEQLMQALEQQARMPMVRIGEALTALGLVTETQLQQALEQQKQERSVPLGELLVRSGQLTRQELQVALARKMGFPVVDVGHFPIDAAALRRVPYPLAQRLKALPLLWRDGLLVVAAEDPSRRSLIEELEFSTQSKVVAALANAAALAAAIDDHYARYGLDHARGPSAEPSGTDYEPANASKLLETLEQDLQQGDDLEPQIEQSDNSLVRLINTMIVDAYNQGASDLHIETHPTKRKVRVRLRKDGRLVPYMELPHTYRSALVARIKIMCDLDISERRKPQDGKIDFAKYSPQHRVELRVATIPTQSGAEDVVMRLLMSAKPLPMDDLGLSPDQLRRLRAVVERPYGMVLCVGPTGSGKTTTLHSILQHLNTPERKIWTAEDPIEIHNPDLRQVQVNPKIDWTFEKALRAFLRADPDIIMVGEIRDRETAQVAIEASLTGHLVLSTLHTNSAPETITRLLDMGMDPFNFADSLLGVLAQRLVRRLCPQCRVSEPASDAYVAELLSDYLHQLPAEQRGSPTTLRQRWETEHGPLQHHHAPGCPHCEHTGFHGRMGLHELLVVDPPLRRLIQTQGRAEEIQHAALADGHFRTLRQDGILKVLAGLTSMDEVRANCN